MSSHFINEVKIADRAFGDLLPARRIAFSPSVDQALRWLPMVAMVTAEAGCMHTRHSLRKRLTIALSTAVVNAIVWPVKHMVRRRRPGFRDNRKSFPSGHSAMSFAGAELWRLELNGHGKWIPVAMYPVAVAAASVRVLRRKHWLSDVVAGALFGVLVARGCWKALKDRVSY